MGAVVTLLPLLVQLISATPAVIATVREATDAIGRAHEEGRDLTDEDWAKVHAAREALEGELRELAKG